MIIIFYDVNKNIVMIVKHRNKLNEVQLENIKYQTLIILIHKENYSRHFSSQLLQIRLITVIACVLHLRFRIYKT